MHLHCSSNFMKISTSVQLSSVAQWCTTLCDPMDCSTPGFPVHHQLLELAQTHVHWVGDTIQTSHPQLSLSPPAFNLHKRKVKVKSLSRVRLFATPGTVAHQAPLSMGILQIRVGCHALLQGIFPTQGSNPGLLHCRWIFFTIWATREGL